MNLLYLLALTRISGVGPLSARALLAHFGNAEAVFKASLKDLLHVQGIGLYTAQHIRAYKAFKECETELAFAQQAGSTLLSIGHENYPKRLAHCPDAPLLLFYKGIANLNAPKILSVVGTRNASAYGKALCDELIKQLAVHEVVIISGLAYGIDGAAHTACIRHQVPTVGVLAHGLDRVYPAAHYKLAQEMLETGGLLTEFPSNTRPDRENFPKRNRLIAGLADATVVVEANTKGGALITADLANSYHREVFAYPGRVQDVYSSGCLNLIKSNQAQLISGADDLLYFLGWDDQEAKKPKQFQMPLELSAEEKVLLSLLHLDEKLRIDSLVLQTKLSQSNVLRILLGLEMKGLIKTLPGNSYQIISP